MLRLKTDKVQPTIIYIPIEKQVHAKKKTGNSPKFSTNSLALLQAKLGLVEFFLNLQAAL